MSGKIGKLLIIRGIAGMFLVALLDVVILVYTVILGIIIDIDAIIAVILYVNAKLAPIFDNMLLVITTFIISMKLLQDVFAPFLNSR